MVLSNNLQKVRFQDVALALADIVDPSVFYLVRCTEKALPSRDGIRTHNGVGCLEVETRVLGCTALVVDELGAKFTGYVVEVWLVVGRC